LKIPDSFLADIDLILKEEKILLSDFHYLDILLESYINLNKIQIEFNSLDSSTFDRLNKMITNNKHLASLNLKLFSSNSNMLNLDNLRNIANMINFDNFEKDKNTASNKNLKKKEKKDVIFDEASYLLDIIYRPFADNLEKLFWNIIERKIHLKFLSINFDMPSYISNNDKFIELFQNNLFLFFEKISAVVPNHKNFDKLKINRRLNSVDSGLRFDEGLDQKSIFGELIKRKNIENTKRKVSYFNLNTINNNSNFQINNFSEMSNTNRDLNENNTNVLIYDKDKDRDYKDKRDNTLKITENKINLESSNTIKNSKETIKRENEDYQNKEDNLPNDFQSNQQVVNLQNSLFIGNNNIKETLLNTPSNLNCSNKFSGNSIPPNLNLNQTQNQIKSKIIYEDNISLNNNKLYEESVLSFEENNFEIRINSDISIQSLEIYAKNFNLDTRKYQIIEKKFQYINLRENNILNLNLDFKFFKFSEKLLNKLIPKKIEDLKLADLDFDSLIGLKNYFTNRRLNNLISLEVKVTNFYHERREDISSIMDFIQTFKGDKLEGFTFITKANFTNENINEIISRTNGDYVKNFSLIISGLKKYENKNNSKSNKDDNTNLVNFDIIRIKHLITSLELKSYYFAINFKFIKAILIRKMIDSNLNIFVNDIYSSSQYIRNTNTSNTSNSNNQLINYGKDHQIKLLKNIRLVVDNIRSFLKIKQEKIFKIDSI